MKYLLVAVLSVMTFVIPVSAAYEATPVGYSKDNYWFCKSVGHTGDEETLAISGVFTADPDTEYSEIEADFSEATYEQLPGYEEAMPARCMDYENRDQANKHRKHQIHLAYDNGYIVEDIKFP